MSENLPHEKLLYAFKGTPIRFMKDGETGEGVITGLEYDCNGPYWVIEPKTEQTMPSLHKIRCTQCRCIIGYSPRDSDWSVAVMLCPGCWYDQLEAEGVFPSDD